jgi:hypothetical protein
MPATVCVLILLYSSMCIAVCVCVCVCVCVMYCYTHTAISQYVSRCTACCARLLTGVISGLQGLLALKSNGETAAATAAATAASACNERLEEVEAQLMGLRKERCPPRPLPPIFFFLSFFLFCSTGRQVCIRCFMRIAGGEARVEAPLI